MQRVFCKAPIHILSSFTPLHLSLIPFLIEFFNIFVQAHSAGLQGKAIATGFLSTG